MDRTTIIVIVICVILLALLPSISNKLFPPKPLPPGATNVLATAKSLPATNAPAAPPAVLPTLSATTAPRPAFLTNVEEETLELTNDNARYTFTSRGGGLAQIELLRYPETVSRQRKGQTASTALATLNGKAVVPVLTLFGGPSLEGDGIFALTRTATGVRAEMTLTNGLRLVKEFQLSTNYLVDATVRLENESSQPLELPAQDWTVGTATPMGPDDKGQMLGMMWYNGAKAEDIGPMWFQNRTLGCIPGVPRTEYRGGMGNVVWAAVHNQFFALAAMPAQPAPQLVAWPVVLPQPAVEPVQGVTNPAPLGIQAAFAYPAVTLAPHATVEHRIVFFAGPKEYRTLARIADRYSNSLDSIMGFDRALGGRFTAFFSKMLLLSMNGLHDLFKVGYGWVIIILTFVIKALFWPLTAASTRSMKRMQALQPQLNALRQKYKDDPAKMNRKMMEFWKENKINPMGGCLPMLLQMPVFIGLYVMIQSAIELRGAHFLWVQDLTKPDTLFVIPGLGFIPFIGIPGVGLPFNLLPTIYIGTALWQSHMTPLSPGMDPAQQKMMRWMPLMFLLILYNFSSGLALYWTVQNLLSIAQTKLTRTTAPAAQPVSVLTPAQKKKK